MNETPYYEYKHYHISGDKYAFLNDTPPVSSCQKNSQDEYIEKKDICLLEEKY